LRGKLLPGHLATGVVENDWPCLERSESAATPAQFADALTRVRMLTPGAKLQQVPQGEITNGLNEGVVNASPVIRH
jgi:hypothetical protein